MGPEMYLLIVLSSQAFACARQEDAEPCAEALARAGAEVYMNDEEAAWVKARADYGRDPEGVLETMMEGSLQLIPELKVRMGGAQ